MTIEWGEEAVRALGPGGGRLPGDAQNGGCTPSPTPAPALRVDNEAGLGSRALHPPINAARGGRKEFPIAWTRI